MIFSLRKPELSLPQMPHAATAEIRLTASAHAHKNPDSLNKPISFRRNDIHRPELRTGRLEALGEERGLQLL